jgi:hypothetical protein
LGSRVETGIRARLSDLDELVEASMKEWKVPGLAFAVIRGDETVVLKGYGERDAKTGSRWARGVSRRVPRSLLRIIHVCAFIVAMQLSEF